MPLLASEPSVHPEHLFDQLPEVDAEAGRWWVLHTLPRSEKTLARRLYEKEVPYFLPVHQRQWRSKGRQLRSFLPLFPGYVFLLGDDRARLAALETNLIANVLPVADQRQLHADLRQVHELISTGAAVTPEDRLAPGDSVEIIKGPFAGLDGKVLRRGKQLHFFVEVQFLRRAVSMEIESWMIQPRAAQAGG
jgi:transcriptional antiterminator RfaH